MKRGHNLSFNVILDLIEESKRVFASEPQLIEVDSDFTRSLYGIVFVGDTHGDFSSTLAVFSEFDPRQYLIIFLGDYIDRGPNSVRNINYILVQKLLHKKNIIVLRGNHETPMANFFYGFNEELAHLYSKNSVQLFERYNELFSFMPYSVLLKENAILALHGGLATKLKKLHELHKIKKGDIIPKDPTAFQILWNDPNEEVLNMNFLKSKRGKNCFYFGWDIVEDFLSSNNLCYIVRGHGHQLEGYNFFFKKQLEQKSDLTKRQDSSLIPCLVRGFKGRLLSVYSSKIGNVTDPKLALVEGGKLSIISIANIYKKRGIQTSSVSTWAKPVIWEGKENVTGL
jgi:protein phosphatase